MHDYNAKLFLDSSFDCIEQLYSLFARFANFNFDTTSLYPFGRGSAKQPAANNAPERTCNDYTQQILYITAFSSDTSLFTMIQKNTQTNFSITIDEIKRPLRLLTDIIMLTSHTHTYTRTHVTTMTTVGQRSEKKFK
jgi:hypothetical protein